MRCIETATYSKLKVPLVDRRTWPASSSKFTTDTILQTCGSFKSLEGSDKLLLSMAGGGRSCSSEMFHLSMNTENLTSTLRTPNPQPLLLPCRVYQRTIPNAASQRGLTILSLKISLSRYRMKLQYRCLFISTKIPDRY